MAKPTPRPTPKPSPFGHREVVHLRHKGFTLLTVEQKVQHVVQWCGHHTLLVASVFLAVVLVWRLAGKMTGKVTGKKRRAKLKKTAPQRSLAAKLAPVLGWGDESEGFVKWPRDAGASGAPIEIRYPPAWAATKSQVAKVTEIVHQYGGGATYTTSHDPIHSRLVYRRDADPEPEPARVELPARYEYDDDPELPIHLIPVADGGENGPVVADFTSESPHVLVAGGTGKGKTSVLTVFTAHVAGRGGLVDILDPKMAGYMAAFRDLPNVRIAVDIPAMVDRVAEFYHDMRYRYEALKDGRDITGMPMRVLIVDERGSFSSMVRSHWDEVKEDGDPPLPPTMKYLQLILWQGRAADFHMITAAQQANASVLDGTDARESYALRIGCGNTGRRGGPLLFGTDDVPRLDAKVKGRGAVCLEGEDVIPAQLAWLSTDRARHIALRGRLSFADYEASPDHYLGGSPVNTSVNIPDSGVFTPKNGASDAEMPTGAGRSHTDPDDGSCDAQTGPSHEDAEPVEVGCGACSARYFTASKSVSRCRYCGHRQRVPVVPRQHAT